MISQLDIVIRLFISCILAGIVGYERQVRHKAAGLRTHVLVSLGACLVMILSINIPAKMQTPNPEYTRMAAQVISGIGFLGAGSIIANRQGISVIGLTTAASMWVVTAIGLAVGAGYWVAAGATTGLVYLTLTLLSRLERHLAYCFGTTCYRSFIITTQDKPGQVGKIGAYFGEAGVSIRDIQIKRECEQINYLQVAVVVDAPFRVTDLQLISGILAIEGIISVKND